MTDGDQDGLPIETVVPKGITGPVWLIVADDAPAIPIVRGHNQVEVPAGGILHVMSLDPFHHWHRSSARFDDGTLLPDSGGEFVKPDTVALRGGAGGMEQEGGRTTQWMAFYIGTAKQSNDWTADDFTSAVPR